MDDRPVVPAPEWLEARKALLAREKDFTRLRDEITKARRALPWEAVTQEYVFEGPNGAVTLSELFDGRTQLIVQHFMYGPGEDWDAGCRSCSFWSDGYDPVIVHLNHRDTSFVAVSRAPYAAIAAYKKRMGWRFNWVSAQNSRFNFDYGVSFTPDMTAAGATYNFGTIGVGDNDELPGLSVFYKNGAGKIFRTYSTYGRGIDLLSTAYNMLDLTPKGRDEGGGIQAWIRRRDEY